MRRGLFGPATRAFCAGEEGVGKVLISEARVVGSALRDLPRSAFPLVNIGSQSAEFTRDTQPWIASNVLDPLVTSGRSVLNVDLYDSPGVDLVADIGAPEGQAAVRSLGAPSIMCSNLLEHVSDPLPTLAAAAELVGVGGYLVLTGPLHYPYHPDPIDNGFRPDSGAVNALLPRGFDAVVVRDVTCRLLLTYDIRRVARLRKRNRTATGTSSTRPSGGWTVGRLLSRLGWSLRRPSAYVVVARRVEETDT